MTLHIDSSLSWKNIIDSSLSSVTLLLHSFNLVYLKKSGSAHTVFSTFTRS